MEQTPESPQHKVNQLCGLPNFPFAAFHRVSDIVTTGLLAANWIYPVSHFKDLPNSIPISYSLKGAINRLGNKYLIILLPVGASILYFHYLYRIMHPDAALFPIKAPPINPGKISILAKTLTKLLSFISQGCILAGSYLLVKGIGLNQDQRASLVQTFILSGIVGTSISYMGIYYLLNH